MRKSISQIVAVCCLGKYFPSLNNSNLVLAQWLKEAIIKGCSGSSLNFLALHDSSHSSVSSSVLMLWLFHLTVLFVNYCSFALIQVCYPKGQTRGLKAALRTPLQRDLLEATCRATGLLACSLRAHHALLYLVCCASCVLGQVLVFSSFCNSLYF